MINQLLFVLSCTGGMNGSIVYELERPENVGLNKSIKVIFWQQELYRPMLFLDTCAYNYFKQFKCWHAYNV